jgi:hypothetical protein
MDAGLKPSAALKTLKRKADPSRFGARDDSVILGRNLHFVQHEKKMRG